MLTVLLVAVPIGGVDQTMMIRGMSTEAPVLLFLAGGPGGTEIGAMRAADVGFEQEWLAMLDAPIKDRVICEESGHRPSFEQPDHVAELMRRVVEEAR